MQCHLTEAAPLGQQGSRARTMPQPPSSLQCCPGLPIQCCFLQFACLPPPLFTGGPGHWALIPLSLALSPKIGHLSPFLFPNHRAEPRQSQRHLASSKQLWIPKKKAWRFLLPHYLNVSYHVNKYSWFGWLFVSFCLFVFSGLHTQHLEIPRLGVQLQL